MADVEEQQRFDNFKLGWGTSELPAPTTKRNSHHRRRSSVSTRHESAELMGVSLPEQQPDDILSDKDHIRRRALWALEGRQEKVEIPELEVDKKPVLEFPTRPSFPPGSGVSSSSMSVKRDSFRLAASASKELDTLHEEDEEDEHDIPQPMSPTTPVHSVAPTRNRPAHLNLRPLSLTPDSLHIGLPSPSYTPNRQALKSLSLLNDNDPYPSHRRPVLNVQITSSPDSVSPCSSSASSDDSKKYLRRSSISYKISSTGLPTPEMTPTFSERRHSSNSSSSRSSLSSFSGDDQLEHQSRESRSGAGALTASEQHFLFKSHNALLTRITDLEKALSLRRRESSSFWSYPSPQSRPDSTSSEFSSNPSEPSDEMLRLVSDLKAERDELKRDVDGWRHRVGDLEKQLGVFAKRVENERREAWVARSKLGLLEGEKISLAKELEESRKQVQELTKSVSNLEAENVQLRSEKYELSEQAERLGVATQELECEIDELKSQLSNVSDDLATPIAPQHGFEIRRRALFPSVDSLDSSTDVECDTSAQFGFALKAVLEESEGEFSEDDNGLAGYEDEEEFDMELQSRDSSSSFGSTSEFSVSVDNAMSSSTTPVASAFQPSHRSSASLSKTWTFPTGAHLGEALSQSDSVDRFFGCLDDNEATSPSTDFIHEYEQAKGLWTSAFKNASMDDDFNPFVLPGHVHGTIVDDIPSTPSSSNSGTLAVVLEEDEEEEVQSEDTSDDEDLFGGEIGGIKITFTPPQADDEKSLHDGLTQYISLPEDMKPLSEAKLPNLESEQTSINVTPPRSFVRVSAIPRPASIAKVSPSPPSALPRLASPKFGLSSSPVNSTPPSKRPSFIPQPITPPSPIRFSTQKSNMVPKATFIRQPQRKPLTPNNNSNSNILSGSTSGSHHQNDLTCKTQPLATPELDMNFTCRSPSGSPVSSETNASEMNDDSPRYEHAMHHTYPQNYHPSLTPSSSSFANLIPIPSPAFSLQTFTSIIPLPWSRLALEGPEQISTTSRSQPAPQRVYVSKEAQLEKLRNRLTEERAYSLTRNHRVDVCRICENEAVHV